MPLPTGTHFFCKNWKKTKSPFEINWPLPSVSPWPWVWPRPCPSSSPGMPTISWGTTWRTATSTTTSATSMSTTFFGIFSSWFGAFRRTIVSWIPFGFYFSHHFFQLVLPVQTGFLGPDFTVNFGPLVCFIWKKKRRNYDYDAETLKRSSWTLE